MTDGTKSNHEANSTIGSNLMLNAARAHFNDHAPTGIWVATWVEIENRAQRHGSPR